MLTPQEEKGFRKDLKLMKKRGKNIYKLQDIILRMVARQPLPAKSRNHTLIGEYKG